mmetsp:Transcript_533/g.560  ORF Transcript_533/g.560 Transcript_533/m.560 type:complete len:561 (-) Transcript_533:164-1846(-)
MNSASDIEIPYGLILHPTMEEFSNFAEYWEKLEKDKKTSGYGIIKIVPPAKWKPRAQPVKNVLNDIMVNSPIEQNVYGKGGIYELLLMQKKSMSVIDYRKKVEVFDEITDKKTPEEVETLFWKSICFSPPLYGADMKGSLFDHGVKWNLNELNGVLKEGLSKPIAGVNDPYLYIGSWKTMFGWHKEDIDLYSINFNHYGKPKFWYALPTSEAPKLEKFAKQHFPEGFSKCKEYLRHKTIMISPYLLKQHIPDLKIHKMIHYPGEFVVTLGGSYHAGFNWGFNIAEAVNFATTKWLDLFEKAESCKCIKDSVKIDHEELFENLAKSSYKDNPTVKRMLKEHNIVLSGKKSEDIEIEKPSRRSSTNYSTRSNAINDYESMEEEASTSADEGLRTRASTRGTKKIKLLTKTRTGKTAQEKSKIKKESKAVPKISRTKRIQKKDVKPVTRKQEEAVVPKQRKENGEVHRAGKIAKARTALLRQTKQSKAAEKEKGKSSLLIENWVQCGDCSKWRKITKKSVWDKVQNKKVVVCKDLPNLTCRTTEENWKTEYMTIPEKYRIKTD